MSLRYSAVADRMPSLAGIQLRLAVCNVLYRSLNAKWSPWSVGNGLEDRCGLEYQNAG